MTIRKSLLFSFGRKYKNFLTFFHQQEHLMPNYKHLNCYIGTVSLLKRKTSKQLTSIVRPATPKFLFERKNIYHEMKLSIFELQSSYDHVQYEKWVFDKVEKYFSNSL